ncbi:unnamed protein product, partial [Symbiodinium pilosum]
MYFQLLGAFAWTAWFLRAQLADCARPEIRSLSASLAAESVTLQFRKAIARSRRNLQAIRQAVASSQSEDEDEDTSEEDESELTSYLCKATLEKCRELDGGELRGGLSKLCKQTDEKAIVQALSEGFKADDTQIVKWICRGVSVATEDMGDDGLKVCQETGKMLLGGLTQIMESGNDDFRRRKFLLYAVKAAAALAPLPPPLGKVIDKAADHALAQFSE